MVQECPVHAYFDQLANLVGFSNPAIAHIPRTGPTAMLAIAQCHPTWVAVLAIRLTFQLRSGARR
jgi:hypothetical protein